MSKTQRLVELVLRERQGDGVRVVCVQGQPRTQESQDKGVLDGGEIFGSINDQKLREVQITRTPTYHHKVIFILI